MATNNDNDTARPSPCKGEKAPQCPPAERFDHLLTGLIEENEGLFLGERHDSPALAQAVIKLLPMLKAHGVRTVSLEFSQERVDAMQQTASYAEYLSSNFCDKRRYLPDEPVYQLVRQARKLGLKILGHEHPRYGAGADLLAAGSQQLEELGRIAARPDGMKERDDYAAKYIQSHRNGKVLVIGGQRHSGRHTRADALSLGDEERLLNGGAVPSEYAGLDSILRLPSIDFRWDIADCRTGSAVKTDGRFSDYAVHLPQQILRQNAGWHSTPIARGRLPNAPRPGTGR
jgi:hypothetical protein